MAILKRLTAAVALVCFSLGLVSAAAAQQISPFCSRGDCAQTRQLLKQICDFIVAKKSQFPTIYIGGYYMRTLVAGYEVFGDRRYLDTAVAYGDYLLGKQMPNGFWGTGYGPVYMADTGSALGLFIALYPHVDGARQKKYLDSVQIYINSIQKDGMIHPNGAFGTGWRHSVNGQLTGPIYDQYTLSSALTGGEIFIWMYHMTKQPQYREISYRALKWVLSTMRSDGDIPHILAMEGFDWDRRSDPAVAEKLWNRQTYGTSAYVGEGFIFFDRYCGDPAMKSWIEKAVRPNIGFLLKTQLPDGTWSAMGQRSWDRTRSPGIINYLIWYYERVDRDPRIVRSVRRFDTFIVDPKNARSYGILSGGADASLKDTDNSFNTATSLTGRALVSIVSPDLEVSR